MAGAPEVTTAEAMQHFFERIGFRVGHNRYETEAALAIEARVRQEWRAR
jgi:hypothetical protein